MDVEEIDLKSVDHVLTTTRAVRKRLDLTRPVEQSVLRECIEIALQAPSGLLGETWHFLILTEPEQRAKISEIYRRAVDPYNNAADVVPDDYLSMVIQIPGEERPGQLGRVLESSIEYTKNLEKVPAFVLACVEGRMEEHGPGAQASMYASIFPAVWSFQLALRARGLGSALTTVHIALEKDVRDAFGIPDTITQAALLPVGYFTGKDFKRSERKPVELVTHWNAWNGETA